MFFIYILIKLKIQRLTDKREGGGRYSPPLYIYSQGEIKKQRRHSHHPRIHDCMQTKLKELKQSLWLKTK